MKTAKISQFIILGMVAAALIVAVIAYSAAWFQVDAATPYTFEIHANGVLYVYVDSVVVDNDASLVPAVAVPGAIAEGLPYDVLTRYNASDASPSYISKVASVTPVQGKFTVYNEGYAYDKVELPKDDSGYTLYPVITSDGKISWIDNSDHSLGWNSSRKPIEWEDDTPVEWSEETDYEPLVDNNGYVVWTADTINMFNGMIAQEAPGYTINHALYRGQEYWKCKEIVREGSSECTVNLRITFKASGDSQVDDYYDNTSFAVRRLYITREDEEIAEGTGMGAAYGNSGVEFVSQSADKLTSSFLMYGSEDFYLHAEVYLAQPDELLDPTLRGKDVYMAISVSVEVTQFGS